MSRYQSIMFEEAFGNYETLLRRVTYNPAMGNYLDMVNNDRAPQAPTTSTRVPNENYAREIMQLFSINLDELNIDGTPVLDAQGNKIQTYGQTETLSRNLHRLYICQRGEPERSGDGQDEHALLRREHDPVPDDQHDGARTQREEPAERHRHSRGPDSATGHRRGGAQRVHAPQHARLRGQAADPAPGHG
jgi:hypothetical protein